MLSQHPYFSKNLMGVVTTLLKIIAKHPKGFIAGVMGVEGGVFVYLKMISHN